MSWSFDVGSVFTCQLYIIFARFPFCSLLFCFVLFLQATIPATLTQQYLFVPQQMKTCFVVQVNPLVKCGENMLAAPLSNLSHVDQLSIVIQTTEVDCFVSGLRHLHVVA